MRCQEGRIARPAAGDRPIASTGAGKWRAASAIARAVPRVSVAAPSAALRAVGPRIAEVAAVERLGRLPREVAMLAEAFEARAIDLARRGERAVLVEAQAGAPRAPVVDRPVARPGVEGEQRAVRADPGHVGDAADIHHGERPRQIAREGCVIDRHQRRALPARRDVGAAQVVHHPHAERPASAAPSPICQVKCLSGRCVMVWPWKPTTSSVDSATPLVARPALHRVEMRLGHRPLGGAVASLGCSAPKAARIRRRTSSA